MKTHISDVLQIVAAVVITSGIVASAAPLPIEKPIVKTETVQAQKAPEKAVEAPQPTITAPPAEEPVVQPQAVPTPAVTAVQPAFVPSGDKASWLAASGIPEDQWGYVDYIVSRESGWNPCAYYPSTYDCSATPVNACGLVMQNPCNKIAADWRDPVAALQWANGYVGRYGGWAGAVAHWKSYGNY